MQVFKFKRNISFFFPKEVNQFGSRKQFSLQNFFAKNNSMALPRVLSPGDVTFDTGGGGGGLGTVVVLGITVA